LNGGGEPDAQWEKGSQEKLELQTKTTEEKEGEGRLGEKGRGGRVKKKERRIFMTKPVEIQVASRLGVKKQRTGCFLRIVRGKREGDVFEPKEGKKQKEGGRVLEIPCEP